MASSVKRLRPGASVEDICFLCSVRFFFAGSHSLSGLEDRVHIFSQLILKLLEVRVDGLTDDVPMRRERSSSAAHLIFECQESLHYILHMLLHGRLTCIDLEARRFSGNVAFGRFTLHFLL